VRVRPSESPYPYALPTIWTVTFCSDIQLALGSGLSLSTTFAAAPNIRIPDVRITSRKRPPEETRTVPMERRLRWEWGLVALIP